MREAPAATPQAAEQALPAQASGRKRPAAAKRGARSDKPKPKLFRQSARKRNSLGWASKAGPHAAAKPMPANCPEASFQNVCAAAAAAVEPARPTPSPSRSAACTSIPRTYEQSPCAASQPWNSR